MMTAKPEQRAEAHYALARALLTRDRARARELAAGAADYDAGTMPAEAAVVRAWLAR